MPSRVLRASILWLTSKSGHLEMKHSDYAHTPQQKPPDSLPATKQCVINSRKILIEKNRVRWGIPVPPFDPLRIRWRIDLPKIIYLIWFPNPACSNSAHRKSFKLIELPWRILRHTKVHRTNPLSSNGIEIYHCNLKPQEQMPAITT